MLENINSPKDIKKLDTLELENLSGEIREFLIKSISETGGHFASNLGVVELTLALHKVFDTPKDKIVWDVGHQAYVHKIITGRKDRFDTLRQFNGMSGFPKRNESEHDSFETGHSSTSISSALGMAMARDIKKEDYSVIAVIGDGALTGGMAFEALNHLGHSESKMIIILNDNEMSISQNVGSMSNYLSKMRSTKTYNAIKDEVENIVSMIPGIGKNMHKTASWIKDSLKNIVLPGGLFEEMGIRYFGPVDGHDIDGMINILKNVRDNIEGPVIIHTVTKKGKGYKYSEERPEKYHGVGSFDLEKGVMPSSKITYSKIAGDKLCELASKDERIVAVTAAMADGTGLSGFANDYPKRFFDVGIAEGHGVTFCAGLAANGLRPYFPVYSTFLQRGFDQILHDACIQKLPVSFLLDRAGLVGNDGETHHGVFDLSYLNMMPNITVMAPKDGAELEKMLELTSKMEGPSAIRYPRGAAYDSKYYSDEAIEIGSWEELGKQEDIVLVGIGKGVQNAIQAREILKKDGISVQVVNGRFLKPMDEKMISDIAKRSRLICTLEDNVLLGGFGQTVAKHLMDEDYGGDFISIGIEDEFVEHGNVDQLEDHIEVSPAKVAQKIRQKLNEIVREVI